VTVITIRGDDHHRREFPSLLSLRRGWATAPGSGRHGKNKPRLIFWELTKGCNLRCIHCRATATELSAPSDLSTEAARDIIDQIAEVSTPILVLSGGEPLFRSDIFQLARYGTDKGLRVALATNGTLVTKHVARMIQDSGVQRVAISLDGADALTHDTFRGIPGAFDAAIAGFRNLKESRHVGADQHHHRPSQCSSASRRPRSGKVHRSRRAAHVPVSTGRLRCGYRRRADGSTGRIRAHAELVLRSVARRWHRIEGNLCARTTSAWCANAEPPNTVPRPPQRQRTRLPLAVKRKPVAAIQPSGPPRWRCPAQPASN
jgi:hypothetical protein